MIFCTCVSESESAIFSQPLYFSKYSTMSVSSTTVRMSKIIPCLKQYTVGTQRVSPPSVNTASVSCRTLHGLPFFDSPIDVSKYTCILFPFRIKALIYLPTCGSFPVGTPSFSISEMILSQDSIQIPLFQ